MILTDIKAALDSLFAGRVYPDVAPDKVAYPYCVYTQIGGVPVATFCGDALDTRNAVFQFNVWSDRRVDSATLTPQLEAALTAAPLLGTGQGNATWVYDEPTKLYGSRVDFSFWYRA